MVIYISGGARSGKSTYAQNLALSLSNQPVYVATAKVWDNDFEKRVKRHQADRGPEWTSYEAEKELYRLPLQNKVVLIDCVTLWLTNYFVEYKNDIDKCLEAIKEEMLKLQKIEGATFIIVSNELGMGLHADSDAGRKFTDLQGWANQYIAKIADKAVFMVSGLPLTLKDNAS